MNASTPMRLADFSRALRSSTCLLRPAVRGAVTAGAFAASAQLALANPQGGVVAEGGASITQTNATTLTIHQNTNKVIIDWRSFSIDANEITEFIQPSSNALAVNRVIGNDPSHIFGQLRANGQIMLLNQNGILFGTGSRVDVNGLVASTIDIPNARIMADDFRFDILGTPGAGIVNRGQITAAESGLVAFMSPWSENSGVIQANLGRVNIGAGTAFTLDLYGDGLVQLAVDRPVVDRLVDTNGDSVTAAIANSGTIQADGGRVLLTASVAQSAVNNVINMDGVIQAQSVATQNGEIILSGGAEGSVNITGTIDASGQDAGESGGSLAIQGEAVMHTGRLSADGHDAGGTVDVSGRFVIHQGEMTADASAGNGGRVTVASTEAYMDVERSVIQANGAVDGGVVEISGGQGTVFASGRHDAGGGSGRGGDVTMVAEKITLIGGGIDASGDGGGGDVRIGGDFHGGGILQTAAKTKISPSTTINASARVDGDGGTAVVWANDTTIFAGTITAEGAGGKTGGLVEVSAKGDLTYAGTVDAAELLLDPTNITISTATGVFPYFDLVEPMATAGSGFGVNKVLSNGNVVVSASGADLTAVDVGAVFLFNGSTGSVISALWGSTASDRVGVGSAVELTNGNFVVASPYWSNGGVANAGAVTWGSGTTGISGIVSAANSLVGSTANDSVGSGGSTALTNGNYVVRSGSWHNGGVVDAGAMTWGNGTTGSSGVVSAANSLVGSTARDMVGVAVTALSNGNYVVSNKSWDNGGAVDAGAVTWGSGTAGVSGVISAANSLVGSTANDLVGDAVTTLTNGNYVVGSSSWDNGGAVDAGAVIWGSGTAGVSGVVSAANSLVGSTAADYIGITIVALSNGNYVVGSPFWDNGGVANVGAVTWGNGTTGVNGVISAANSLVGSTAGDAVGNNVVALTNGNYVVGSSSWDNGGVANVGSVTWGNGATGTTGVVSVANSLVGGTLGDAVGGTVVTLTNGNYVVRSSSWDNGGVANIGAVTWGNGAIGTTGVVSVANSLVGGTAGDLLFSSVTALTNGNYVVSARLWDNGAASNAGAVTWGNGATGTTGVISAANSLVGGTAGDIVGRFVTALTNGNYVVGSSSWDNGGVADVGAVTWGDGATGTTGVVSAANSLVGSTANDIDGTVTALTNGAYVVTSKLWDNGGVADVGAMTWGSRTTGVSGVISAANSLVGSTTNDMTASAVIALTNGNYVVRSSYWDNGGVVDAGAVTWGSGTTGVSGAISATNSLVGSTASDNVGATSVTALSNGNYIVVSAAWDDGGTADAGAVTWGDGTTGAVGAISSVNSMTHANQAFENASNNTVLASHVVNRTIKVLLPDPSLMTYSLKAGASINLHPDFLTGTLNKGTAVTLQASNDITVNSAITANNTSGDGGALTLSAGRSIVLNANITTDNGNLTLIGNDLAANGVLDAQRAAGSAAITMATGTAIDAGTGNLNILLRQGTGLTQRDVGDITLDRVTASHVLVQNTGGSPGADILMTQASSLITATSVALDLQNTANTNGSIGTAAQGVRVAASNVEARTQSGGIWLTSPTQGFDVGGATLGGLTGITTNGTLSLTTVGNITGSEALSVAGATTLAAGAGNDITLNAAGNNFSSVGITSGRNVAIADANALALNATTVSGALGVRAVAGLTVSGAVTSEGATTLNADSNSDGTGNLTVNAAVVTTNNTLGITANDVVLASTLNSGSGATTITDSDGTGIGLGGTAVTNGLNLTDAELAKITARGLTLTGAGPITVNGISAANSNTVAGMTTLTSTGGAVAFATGASTFNALTVNAGDGISVGVDVTTDTGRLSLNGDSNNGADTNDNIALNANLTSAGAMTLAALTGGVDLGAATTLTAGGVVTVRHAVDGNVNLTVDAGTNAIAFNGTVGGTTALDVINLTGGAMTGTINASSMTVRGPRGVFTGTIGGQTGAAAATGVRLAGPPGYGPYTMNGAQFAVPLTTNTNSATTTRQNRAINIAATTGRRASVTPNGGTVVGGTFVVPSVVSAPTTPSQGAFVKDVSVQPVAANVFEQSFDLFLAAPGTDGGIGGNLGGNFWGNLGGGAAPGGGLAGGLGGGQGSGLGSAPPPDATGNNGDPNNPNGQGQPPQNQAQPQP